MVAKTGQERQKEFRERRGQSHRRVELMLPTHTADRLREAAQQCGIPQATLLDELLPSVAAVEQLHTLGAAVGVSPGQMLGPLITALSFEELDTLARGCDGQA